MSKATPGPWHVVPPTRAEHRWVIGTKDESSVASCEPIGPWMSSEEADANATLIAAAPDMAKDGRALLLALAKVLPSEVAIVHAGTEWRAVYQHAQAFRAALSKASAP